MSPRTTFSAFQLIAGSCDAVTGILLLAAPAFTLRLMGIRKIVSEPIFISFIGAFVFSVGLIYLLYSVPPRNASEISEVRSAWLITAIVRLCVGLFIAGACLAHKLEPAWITITIVDLSLAVFQLKARRSFFHSFA